MDISKLLLKHTGMSRIFKNKTGWTLVEAIAAVLLLSLIFMAVSSLYVASQRFYLASSQKVIIGYEVQYAIQHIYKYTMKSIGDSTALPFQIYSGGAPSSSGDTVYINIHNNDLALPPSPQPLTKATYDSAYFTSYRYYYDPDYPTPGTGSLMFQKGADTPETLIPKLTVTGVNFTKSGNALTGYITAYYNDQTKPLTFYFSCYPRLASFN
jgi:hypothetical protein